MNYITGVLRASTGATQRGGGAILLLSVVSEQPASESVSNTVTDTNEAWSMG